MNSKRQKVNLLESNVLLKIVKVFLLAFVCIIPLAIIAILFTKGKIPSFSIEICLMIGSLWGIKQEFGSLRVVGFTSKSICKHITYGIILCVIYFHILFDSINEMLIVNRSLEITLTALIIIVLFIISTYREKGIHLIKN